MTAGAELPQHSPVPILAVPVQAPRVVQVKFTDLARSHRFSLLFGAIWAAVGGLNALIFGLIAIAMWPLVLGAAIGSFFLIAGLAILAWGLSGVARDRALLEHGQVVNGEITEIRSDSSLRVNRKYSTRITYRYRGADGQWHSDFVRIFDDDLIAYHRQIKEIPLLVDPDAPGTMVAPTLTGARFGEVEAPRDGRRRSSASPQRPPAPSSALRATLRSSARPLPRGWWRLLRRRGARRDVAMQLGLEESGRLTQEQEGRAVAEVDLSRPFTINCTTWLLDPRTAELHVTIRQQGAPPGDPGVRFGVLLPHERVSADVPLKQDAAPLLDAEPFRALWDAIGYYASLHGELPRAVLSDGLDTATPTDQHVHAETVSATRR